MNMELLLKEKHIKVTKGRMCILDVLASSECSVEADYVMNKCKEKGLSIDLSTVYRTLELLYEKDIIDKFDLGDGKYNYVIKREKHKHILHCSVCEKEVEIDCPMLQVEEVIKSKTGFILVEHDLKIKGICEECGKKRNSSKKS